MMNYEGYDQGSARPLAWPCHTLPCMGLYEDGRLAAYPLTYDQAIAAARERMCAIDGYWCTASATEIKNRICGQNDLFVGVHCGDDFEIRCGLGCPTAAQVAACGPCGGVPGQRYTCVNGTCVAGATGTYATLAECLAAGCKAPVAGGINTALVVGGLAVLAALAFFVASQGQKKVVIARVEK